MDAKQIAEKRQELRDDMMAMVEEFTHDTGAVVDYININQWRNGKGEFLGYLLDIDVIIVDLGEEYR